MKRKIVSVLLCVLMLASLLPVSAFADTTAGGTCGENLTWTLDSEGTLTISGTGAMPDYSYDSKAPWYSSRSSIKSVTIGNSVTRIGSSAFYDCSSLESMTIPNSVTSIGKWAFYGCSSLTSVTIPDSVTSIGYYAFYNCSSLESATIGNSVSSIGYGAFDGCSSLASVTIPDSVTSIGDYAFYDCTGLTSVTIGNSVTSIGDDAFCGCSSLTSVTIPDSVTSIGISAFSGCSSLVSMTIPDSVTSIGISAFSGCSSLASVTIPNSVTSIGDYAFSHCSSLESVTIPDSVTSIGEGAFRGCSSLASVTIPDSVTSIGISAFSGCSSLVSMTIPDSVTSIGDYAFLNCSSLASVTIPDSVTSIGSSAFYGCSSLASVTIPDSVTSIGDHAFCDCSSLTSVTIGNSVKSIGGCAFEGCISLASVTIPNSVTTISESAFSGCSSLTSVTIPDSVISIGDYAFDDCSKLNDIAFAGSKDAWASIEKGDEAFSTSPRIHYNCTTLEGHIIPMERKDPSCTSTGYIKYSCACGYEFTELLPENHDYVFIKSVAATCSNAGYDVYKCSKCGKILNKSNGEEQLPHDYELTKAVEPTCTEHGYDVYKCAACGASKTETRNDELLPHDYVVTVVEPTCLKGGYTLHKCSVCGDEYKDNLTALLGHSMVEVGEKPATCTEAGHTAGVQCSRCGLVESGVTEIPALGHSYGNWTQTKAPTCTAKGTETGRCTRCNAAQTRDVAALGHDIIPHAAKAATCTEKGWEAYDTCNRCDYTTYKEIPATGHNYIAKVFAPTCTVKGYTTHTCITCGDSYTDEYTDSLGHDRIHHAAKAATCTEIGWEAYDNCSRCNYTTYKEIPATGHHHDAVVTAPTCTEKGYTTHTCACGDSYVDTYTNALGHSYGAWTQTKAPTCTAKGTETKTCTRCNATETRDVEALGHNTTHHAAKAATCTEIGWEAYDTCSRCDYTTYKEIAKTGHQYVETVFAPTCTVKGYTTHTCSVCGDNYIDSYVDALGHDRIHHDGMAPTCTESGFEAYDTCSRCDYTTYKEIPATGHHHDAVVTAPTCTEKGYTTHTCACGDSYVDDHIDALGHNYKKGVCTRCGEKDPNYVAAPVIKITTSAGKPKISWSKVDGAARYKVFYSTDGKKYDLLATTTGTSITNTKAKIGTKYFYKVKAVNAGAESEFSNVESIKCRPAAPTVTISRSGGKAKLSWKAVSGATKYWVYRSTDGKKYTCVISTTKLSYADSKSKSGKKYYYKVMAVAVVNKTDVGSAFSAVKSIMTTLAKPTVKITTSNGKPKLTWGKVTGADKYYVYRSTNGKDYTLLVKTTKTSVTNTGAKKGTKYYYKVKAICSANTKANSVFSTVVSIKATK